MKLDCKFKLELKVENSKFTGNEEHREVPRLVLGKRSVVIVVESY